MDFSRWLLRDEVFRDDDGVGSDGVSCESLDTLSGSFTRVSSFESTGSPFTSLIREGWLGVELSNRSFLVLTEREPGKSCSSNDRLRFRSFSSPWGVWKKDDSSSLFDSETRLSTKGKNKRSTCKYATLTRNVPPLLPVDGYIAKKHLDSGGRPLRCFSRCQSVSSLWGCLIRRIFSRFVFFHHPRGENRVNR